MAKKNLFNEANEIDLMGDVLVSTGHAAPQKENKEELPSSQQSAPDTSWTHFTVICSLELVDKIKAIAQKEDFTIREVVEKFFRNGIGSYESKHGHVSIRRKKRQNIDDIL